MDAKSMVSGGSLRESSESSNGQAAQDDDGRGERVAAASGPVVKKQALGARHIIGRFATPPLYGELGCFLSSIRGDMKGVCCMFFGLTAPTVIVIVYWEEGIC